MSTKFDPSKWGIVKLKSVCAKLNLDGSGTKKEVLERLKKNCSDLEYVRIIGFNYSPT
jgi:hypothetical protein